MMVQEGDNKILVELETGLGWVERCGEVMEYKLVWNQVYIAMSCKFSLAYS